ncbi:MAG TPA: hypothetical protein VLV49_15725 [Terriglobales bacterium]|nr:hypothetical protein [Terriglobales bacterium]
MNPSSAFQVFVIRGRWLAASSPRRVAGGLLAVALCLALSAGAAAQSSPPEGVDNGNYHYAGSFEFGYRFVNTNGSGDIYDTYVDEHQGPRLLDQTLSMRSLNHAGVLFDNLFLSSFGWGGDPENATRLRISKNKWYNFSAMFRRDKNFWDYNLLANPLNPPNAFISNDNSPHEMLTTRRMYDYGLTLFPQSRIRFRLGYTRNNMEGPAFSSIHQGTDTVLFQNTRTLLDGYQAGVDIKLLPRTNLSYDQFLQYYRGDSTWADDNQLFQLSNGTPVDAGMIYNAAAGQPCSNTPTPIFDTSTSPPTLKATCNGQLSYTRSSPTRISYPTEQLTLQSSYFRRMDISARGSYSSDDTKVDNFAEDFNGLLTRTAQRVFDGTGLARDRRIVASVDFGVTFYITQKLRLSDSFRFSNFRIPGFSDQTTVSLFGAGAASLLSPTVSTSACPPTCPTHSSSSPADLATDLFSHFLQQDAKYNTVEVEYDVTKRFGGHLGYRYTAREVNESGTTFADELFYPTLPNRGDCATVALNADGTCSFSGVTESEADSVDIHQHAGIFGVWAHPSDALRVNFDTEIMSADNALTRISPRNLQRYKGRAQYKPAPWMNVSGTVNVLESRDNVPDTLHREHDRNYGFALLMTPRPRFGVDLGYNYDDIFSTTNICYVITSSPPANSAFCSSGTPYLSAVSLYTNKINFGYANFMIKPVKRTTLNLGYNLTSTSGTTLILGPTPNTLGPLGFNFHKPTASVDIELAKGLTWRTGWNYYDYNEKSIAYPLPPRDFQSNSATLSIVYAF